jgi:hypothetical protein
MIYFIKDNQLKSNLKRFNYQSYDDEVVKQVNELHEKLVSDLLVQKKKQQAKQQKAQKGGRVSFPIDFFGGQTNNLTTETPDFTNISGNDVNSRQEIPLNDPSQVLGTEQGMTSGMIGGSRQQYKLSQTAAQEAVKSLSKKEKFELQDKQQFTQVAKQKFETVMTEVLMKAKQKGQDHLSAEQLKNVLSLKKYKLFKA